MKMTQNERLLSALLKGSKISAAQAASRFKIRNLRARISELRNQANVEIDTDFRVARDGKTTAVYSIQK